MRIPKSNQTLFWFLIGLIAAFILVIGLLLIRQPSVVVVQSGQEPIQMIAEQRSGDDRYTRAPEAERDWIAGPDLSRIPTTPFNIPTQGIPESYQSMGVIKIAD